MTPFRPKDAVRPLRLLILVLLAPGLLGAGILNAQQARPQGEWRLNKSNSDSVPGRFGGAGGAEGTRAGPRDGPPGVVSPGMGPRGGGYGGGSRGTGLGEKDLARRRQTMDLLRDPPRRIRFGAGESTFTITDATGAETTWRIDGKKVRQPVEGGGDVETKVRWKAEALVFERTVDGGGRVTETYELGLGGTRLLVFVDLGGMMEPLASTRQYEPADSE